MLQELKGLFSISKTFICQKHAHHQMNKSSSISDQRSSESGSPFRFSTRSAFRSSICSRFFSSKTNIPRRDCARGVCHLPSFIMDG